MNRWAGYKNPVTENVQRNAMASPGCITAAAFREGAQTVAASLERLPGANDCWKWCTRSTNAFDASAVQTQEQRADSMRKVDIVELLGPGRVHLYAPSQAFATLKAPGLTTGCGNDRGQ